MRRERAKTLHLELMLIVIPMEIVMIRWTHKLVILVVIVIGRPQSCGFVERSWTLKAGWPYIMPPTLCAMPWPAMAGPSTCTPTSPAAVVNSGQSAGKSTSCQVSLERVPSLPVIDLTINNEAFIGISHSFSQVQSTIHFYVQNLQKPTASLTL